jgi:hypothetical protein
MLTGVTPTLASLPPHLLLLTMPPLELTAGTTHRAGKYGGGVAFVHFSRGGHWGWGEESSRLGGAPRLDLPEWSSLGDHAGGCAQFARAPPSPPLAIGDLDLGRRQRPRRLPVVDLCLRASVVIVQAASGIPPSGGTMPCSGSGSSLGSGYSVPPGFGRVR